MVVAIGCVTILLPAQGHRFGAATGLRDSSQRMIPDHCERPSRPCPVGVCLRIPHEKRGRRFVRGRSLYRFMCVRYDTAGPCDQAGLSGLRGWENATFCAVQTGIRPGGNRESRRSRERLGRKQKALQAHGGLFLSRKVSKETIGQRKGQPPWG